jgi:hypothetical protein
MRACVVYIIGFQARSQHVQVAQELFAVFRRIVLQEGEVYSPQLCLLAQETEEAVRSVFSLKSSMRPDYILSIGTDISCMLKKIYTEIKPVPTLFVCPIDPIGNGLIQSFESPGGWFSGVHGQETPMETFVGTQDMFKWLLPYVTKILIPYDIEARPQAYEATVLGVAGELERIGFEPIVERVIGAESVANVVYDRIAQVHAVASFAVCKDAERTIGYMCGMTMPKRLLISSNGVMGIKHGAALTIRRQGLWKIYDQAIVMLRRGWCERIWPGHQQVIVFSDADLGKTELVVNPFMLPHLPEYILKAMRQTPDVVEELYWPYHPANNKQKDIIQKG